MGGDDGFRIEMQVGITDSVVHLEIYHGENLANAIVLTRAAALKLRDAVEQAVGAIDNWGVIGPIPTDLENYP